MCLCKPLGDFFRGFVFHFLFVKSRQLSRRSLSTSEAQLPWGQRHAAPPGCRAPDPGRWDARRITPPRARPPLPAPRIAARLVPSAR